MKPLNQTGIYAQSYLQDSYFTWEAPDSLQRVCYIIALFSIFIMIVTFISGAVAPGRRGQSKIRQNFSGSRLLMFGAGIVLLLSVNQWASIVNIIIGVLDFITDFFPWTEDLITPNP